ncbi:MAG TPA: hypothetical protein VGU74_14860 [Gemmatimonadales bacterium]|nr:hypothetical protein [Gemmatimonadales bacterium]
MSHGRALLLAVLSALAPSVAFAQAATTVARTGVYFESYTFGSGLAFRRVSELTVPVAVSQRVGNRFVIDVATAYASASAQQAGGPDIEHSGLVDTDVRATMNVVPGRLLFTVVATLPTGATTVPDTTIPLFGATATDLLAFTTPNFGTGGGVSSGFASAFRMGANWAVGAAASYRYGASYVPVTGGSRLIPGGEIRARAGIEGPFGGDKYFRGALVYTTTAENDIGGGEQSAIGDRVLAYGAASLPVGNGQLSIYGWDMRRLRARNENVPATIAVPRGNVLALGARLDKPLSPNVTLVPLVEFRHELTGPADKMELLGYLLRGGADLRYRLSDRATGVIHAQLAIGTLQDEGIRVSVVGPRVGMLIEWSR